MPIVIPLDLSIILLNLESLYCLLLPRELLIDLTELLLANAVKVYAYVVRWLILGVFVFDVICTIEALGVKALGAAAVASGSLDVIDY